MNTDKKTYELYSGNERMIAEKIQQRRYQMLIHSAIYYNMDTSIISDNQWDMWAVELKTLQEHYPDIAKNVMLYEQFKDWDASTGAFLPINEEWVIQLAKRVLSIHNKPRSPTAVEKKTVVRKGRLF